MIQRIKLFLSCCFILHAGLLYAQKNPSSIEKNREEYTRKSMQEVWMQQGEVRLRWQPLGLVNVYDMNLTVGVEYAYRDNRSVMLDVGYIFSSLYGQTNNSGGLSPASGLILRSGHRWFFGRYGAQFIEAEGGLKAVKYKGDEEWVGRGVVNGVPAYEELMRITSKKEVVTLNAKYGYRFAFGRQSPVSMEIFAGIGVRYRNYYPQLPADAEVIEFAGWGFDPFSYGSDILPDFPMGLRLTLKL
jgi:hypothetical protein